MVLTAGERPNGSTTQRVVRRRREHFIPLPRSVLVDAFASDLAATDLDRARLEHLCQLLATVVHRDYQLEADGLKEAYLPFDPDSDTHESTPTSETEEIETYGALCDRMTILLRRANFRRLSRAEIDAALSGLNNWGVNLYVDFGAFERLDVFARGDVIVQRRKRSWRRMLRTEEVELPIFQRLAVVFRLRKPLAHPGTSVSAEPLFIKLFKDIPQSDIESLLPGSRIRMTWWDQSRILVPTLSGLGVTLVKLLQGAVGLLFAGIWGVLAFLGLVGGTIGYGVRTFYGYLRTKDKYQLHLTRNLYYQNLDNNRGAILRLIDEAEEQEFRELLLAYFLLWRDAPAAGWTADELDAAAEAWLSERIGQSVDFEIPDAIRKLDRLRLASRGPGERWRAVPLDEAYRRLIDSWRSATDPPAEIRGRRSVADAS